MFLAPLLAASPPSAESGWAGSVDDEEPQTADPVTHRGPGVPAGDAGPGGRDTKPPSSVSPNACARPASGPIRVCA